MLICCSKFLMLFIFGSCEQNHLGNNRFSYFTSRFEFFPVAIVGRKHPFPSRTRKLSSSTPMVLQGRPCGRVGRCRVFLLILLRLPRLFSIQTQYHCSLISYWAVSCACCVSTLSVSPLDFLTAHSKIDQCSPVAQWQSGWLLTTRLQVQVLPGEPNFSLQTFKSLLLTSK